MSPKEIADRIEKAMEGVTPGRWSAEIDLPFGEKPRLESNEKLICEIGNAENPAAAQDEWDANARYLAACNPDNLRTLLADYRRQFEEIERLEGELYDAQQVPWPKWAEKIVKVVRGYSGYDGYDDATEGVDVVAEVEESLSELYSDAERSRAVVARQSELLEEARKVVRGASMGFVNMSEASALLAKLEAGR